MPSSRSRVSSGPTWTRRAGFIRAVGRMLREGYRLAAANEDGEDAPVGVVGFRIYEMLAYSKILYVDDLVVSEGARSGGAGKALIG